MKNKHPSPQGKNEQAVTTATASSFRGLPPDLRADEGTKSLPSWRVETSLHQSGKAATAASPVL